MPITTPLERKLLSEESLRFLRRAMESNDLLPPDDLKFLYCICNLYNRLLDLPAAQDALALGYIKARIRDLNDEGDFETSAMCLYKYITTDMMMR